MAAFMVAGLAAGVSALALLQGGPPARASNGRQPSDGYAAIAEPKPLLAPPAARPVWSSAAPALRAPSKTDEARPATIAAKQRTKPASPIAPKPKAVGESTPGWENPFPAPTRPPSSELGAVLDQPLDGRSTPGDTELPEGRR